MGANSPADRVWEGRLNTLAQNRTGKGRLRVNKPEKLVTGRGTALHKKEALKSRAKRKLITQKMALGLVDVAANKSAAKRVKAYWNTYHCQNQITSSGTRIYGKYCKNRFCTLCNANRKAELINKYLPVVKKWADPHFVTLTAKSVPAKSLKKRVSDLIRGLRIIVDRHKKRSQRGKGKKLVGIRSVECNFNPVKRTYNPHIHLLVPDQETAEILVSEWQSLCTNKFALPFAQKVRRVEDAEHDLIEIVKYSTKIFTDPEMKKKCKKSPYVYLSALDNIFAALQGHRVFERFGFNLPKKLKVSVRSRLTSYTELRYDPKLCDWVDPETEKVLTDYKPPPALMAILENNIDCKIE